MMDARGGSGAGRRAAGPAMVVLCASMPALLSAQVIVQPRALVSTGPPDTAVHEVAIASNGAGELVCMWMQKDATKPASLRYAVSSDGAASWGPEALFPLPSGCTGSHVDPWVIWDAHTQRFVACGLGCGVTIGCRAVGGTFGNTTSLRRTADYPHLAVGPRDGGRRIYLTTMTLVPLRLHVRTCDTEPCSPGAWTEPATRAELTNAVFPAVGPTGRVFVACIERPTMGGDLFVRCLVSDDQGDSFIDSGFSQRLAVTTSDYGPWVAGRVRVRYGVAAAADPTDPDRVYVVFADFANHRAPEEDGDLDVFCTRGTYRTDAGWTWTTPVRMNTDSPSLEQDQFHPAVTVDDRGRVHAFWYDNRDYPRKSSADESADPIRFGIYYARSTDHGVTFANFRVDDQTIDTRFLSPKGPGEVFIGDYHAITTDGPDVVVIAYMGTNHLRSGETLSTVTDQAIFSSRIVQVD